MKNQNNRQSEKEQLQAAYALNLCTVSVSQIVDYDNLYVMEQEYDAILNNLDLEKIFKDDSLLDVVEQILKTITYFKMEDVEKKIIEKEYQQQMKNAIWSAVPNFGLIVAGGNPLTMAISLASQVGIGYMNYRKSKNQYAWDKEKKMLKLQQAAMEQLNGLRFELFKAAWKLEEKNNYPDKYRLTEKQLKEYNEILKDSDPIRKYRRLDRIKNHFEAYPPFWYFLGSTANCVANTSNLSDNMRAEHKECAIEAFKKYKEEFCKIIPLREDPITSSFALEYADILISDLQSKNVKAWKEEEITEIKDLINLAVKNSQHSYDVLELCLIAFLRINDRLSARQLLEHLIDADYNKIANAQLLSSIYVQERNTVGYGILEKQVGSEYLFPMPKEGQSLEDTNEEFIKQQKEVLKKRYRQVIDEIVEKYSIQWNKIYSTFDCDMKYEDLLSMFGTKKNYVNYLSNLDIEMKLLNVLNDSYEEFFSLPILSSNYEVANNVKIIVEQNVRDKEDSLKDLRNIVSGDSFGLEEYKKLQDLSIKNLYGQGISKLEEECKKYVDRVDCEKITEEEGKLRLICNEKKISYPEVILSENSEDRNEDKRDFSSRPFSLAIFGSEAVDRHEEEEEMKKKSNCAQQKWEEKHYHK